MLIFRKMNHKIVILIVNFIFTIDIFTVFDNYSKPLCQY